MDVVVVHDYATQRGGAERVALDMLRAFPDARLVTSCWSPRDTFPEFARHRVETLWTNRMGPLRSDPRRAFAFLASAFARHLITDADVVLCSSSGWAHRVRSTAPKIVYCHNPARWLYQPDDYFAGLPAWVRDRFTASAGPLRRSDAAAARDAAAYLVNSSTVAARVQSAYGLAAEVVPPARGLSPDGPQRRVAGLEPGFLLTVSRPRNYKHTEVVLRAAAQLPGEHLVVVGGGVQARSYPLGVTALDRLDDAELRWLYAHAGALVAVSHEDFGLTPVEAQAFGLPSVVLRAGGYLDTSVEDVTAVFVDEATPAQVAAAVTELRRRQWSATAIRRCGERFSPTAFAERLTGVVDRVLAGTWTPPVRTLAPVPPARRSRPLDRLSGA